MAIIAPLGACTGLGLIDPLAACLRIYIASAPAKSTSGFIDMHRPYGEAEMGWAGGERRQLMDGGKKDGKRCVLNLSRHVRHLRPCIIKRKCAAQRVPTILTRISS